MILMKKVINLQLVLVLFDLNIKQGLSIMNIRQLVSEYENLEKMPIVDDASLERYIEFIFSLNTKDPEVSVFICIFKDFILRKITTACVLCPGIDVQGIYEILSFDYKFNKVLYSVFVLNKLNYEDRQLLNYYLIFHPFFEFKITSEQYINITRGYYARDYSKMISDNIFISIDNFFRRRIYKIFKHTLEDPIENIFRYDALNEAADPYNSYTIRIRLN